MTVTVIAELGTNWERVHGETRHPPAQLMAAASLARDSGADAIKLQIGLENLYNKDRAPKQWAALQKYRLGSIDVMGMRIHCNTLRLQLWASIFDIDAVESCAPFLDGLKIASGDITNLPLIHEIGTWAERMQIPVAFSIGAAIAEEVQVAYNLLSQYNIPQVFAFVCTSTYPAKVADCNLQRCTTLRGLRNTVSPDLVRMPRPLRVGFSDHTMGHDAALVALGMNITVFEKHFKPASDMASPDNAVSLAPPYFADYVDALRYNEHALGSGTLRYIENERYERDNARRGSDGLRPRDHIML